jgi:hypothetical protein
MIWNQSGRPRLSERIRRFFTRPVSGRALKLAVPMAIAGLTLALAGVFVYRADLHGVGRTVLLLLSPALLINPSVRSRGGDRAPRARSSRSTHRTSLQPANAPIEQIAADLRLMLWKYEILARSNDRQIRAGQLRALEVQISGRAVEAARALDLAHPDPPVFGGFDTGQLRPLLRALTANGLVLPPDVGLLQSDSGF